jgi:hypothetical protein
MYYLIYKTTNKLNNKFYVGKHKTKNKDDSYLGSSILIERAIQKYGRENFIRELLFEFSTELEMNKKESDIVDEEFVSRDDTYNLAWAVEGGASCITDDDRRRGAETFKKRYVEDIEFREALLAKKSLFAKIRNLKYGFGRKKGWKHTDETRKKMSLSGRGKRTGENNGVFGTHWVINGIESKMVDRSYIPDGWRQGHSFNKEGKLSEEHRKNCVMHIKENAQEPIGKQRVTNGKINKMVDKDLPIEEGWRKGRYEYK